MQERIPAQGFVDRCDISGCNGRIGVTAHKSGVHSVEEIPAGLPRSARGFRTVRASGWRSPVVPKTASSAAHPVTRHSRPPSPRQAPSHPLGQVVVAEIGEISLT